MGILDDSGSGRTRGRIALNELARLAVAAGVAAGSAFGYMEFMGPNDIVTRADPEVLRKIARPNAFTSKDGERLEGRIAELENTVRELEKLADKFLSTGPKMVRENQEKILTELRVMRRQQEEHFRDFKTSRREPVYPSGRPW